MPGYSRPKVSRITLAAIVHATESSNKVILAISALNELVKIDNIEKQRTRGHYGNDILVLRANLLRRREAEDFLQQLWTRLSPSDKSLILDKLEGHVSASGHLHIRLDKQQAVLGRVAVGQSEPIRIEITFDTRSTDPAMVTSMIRQKLESMT